MEHYITPTTQPPPPPPPPPPESDSPTVPPESEHIVLSPHRSSDSSDRTIISHLSSPENEKPQSIEKQEIIPPQAPKPVVHKSVFQEPKSVVNRAVLEEPTEVVSEKNTGGGGGDGQRRFKPSLSILKRGKREKMVKRAALGFRVLGFLFCLASFAVMAADRNQGWAVDSFERYKEFRYSMSVNVIGFVYSGAQGLDLAYTLATGKYIMHHQQQFRHYFDFAVDQMIAYLLISASSSAATRIDDWQSNWGKDKFPDMATASIAISFLAFVAIASSSLFSGYALYTSKSL